MIGKYRNPIYATIESQNVPIATGDRRWAQDRVRDFWYQVERAGFSAYDLYGMLPFFVSGGVVTQGAGASLDITAGVGYAKFEVEIPDTFASLPPSSTNEDVEAHRIEWPLKNDMNASDANCSTYSITDDGVTTHYVKVSFAQADGNTRDRAKLSGNYVYEKNPSYDFVVDTVAPTDYDIVLDTFTSNAGVYTFAGDPAQKLNLPTISDLSPRVYRDEYELEITTAMSPYTISNTEKYGRYYLNASGGNVVVNLPDRATNNGKIIEFFVNADPGSNTITINRAGADTISADALTAIQPSKLNDELKIIASSILTRWEILSERISCLLRLDTYAGYGSTDTMIVRFTNKREGYGNYFSENHTSGYNSNNEGLEITINRSGKYFFTGCVCSGANNIHAGFSLNSSQLTTAIFSINATDRLIVANTVGTANDIGTFSWGGYLAKNDVIRFHADSDTMTDLSDNVHFTGTYMGN